MVEFSTKPSLRLIKQSLHVNEYISMNQQKIEVNPKETHLT